MKIILALIELTFVSFVYSQKDCKTLFDSVKTRIEIIDLIDTLSNKDFETKKNKKDIPDFITEFLKCKAIGFDIANPKERYNATDVVDNRFPRRQLSYLGLNNEYIIISYKHGGIGMHEHLIIFNVDNQKILSYWSGYPGVNSKEEMIAFLKAYKKNPLRYLPNYSEF